MENLRNIMGLSDYDNEARNELIIGYIRMINEYDLDSRDLWTDEKGVVYKDNKKILYKATKNLENDYTIRSGTVAICNHAFDKVEVQNIFLPEGLIAIGDFALFRFKQPIELPSSVEYIGETALPNVYKKFVFPKSLKEIHRNGIPMPRFDTSGKELDVEFISESPEFPIINGCLIHYGELISYLGNDTHVVIPDGVTIIGVNAFYCKAEIQGVEIPDTVTKIGEGAFGECTSLESITIPASVTQISRGAFYNCNSLQTINILGTPDIAQDAFTKCPGLKQ
ncbi:MAG: leucine-rich repeat domain-containing protein [Clostridia bacterium]|nr:leucine-rich repeat domain-containing protein [Clostridia bacterium]